MRSQTRTSGAERHVAAFAFPFSSHPRGLLSFVRRLSSATPCTTFSFSFFSTAKSNQALFPDPISDSIRPYDVPDGIPENYVSTGQAEEYISLFLGVAEAGFRRCVKAAEADIGLPISCLVTDSFLWFSGEIAEEMNVPWVALRTSGAPSLATHFYTDLIRQKVGATNRVASEDDEIVDLIPAFPRVRLGDLPTGVVLGNIESPLAIMVHKMGQNLTKAAAIPVNSFDELNPDITKDLSTKFNNFLNMGPFNLTSKRKQAVEDKFSCIPWLEGQKPHSVAYICFGTVVQPPVQELVALCEALEETETPFLWSIKDDSKRFLPQGFLERRKNGKVVPWAPQEQVLEHGSVGVFVTHSGWNSVMESVAAGVPMICRPFFGDQKINSWMVEKVWEIGVRIDDKDFTKHAVCGALQHVLSSKRLKDRVTVFKQFAHKAVEPDGPSTQNFNTLLQVITGSPQL